MIQIRFRKCVSAQGFVIANVLPTDVEPRQKAVLQGTLAFQRHQSYSHTAPSDFPSPKFLQSFGRAKYTHFSVVSSPIQQSAGPQVACPSAATAVHSLSLPRVNMRPVSGWNCLENERSANASISDRPLQIHSDSIQV